MPQSGTPAHLTLLTVPFSPFRHRLSTHSTHSPTFSSDHMSTCPAASWTFLTGCPFSGHPKQHLVPPALKSPIDPLALRVKSLFLLSPLPTVVVPSADLTSSRLKGSVFWPLSPYQAVLLPGSLFSPSSLLGLSLAVNLLQVPTQTASPSLGAPFLRVRWFAQQRHLLPQS